MCSALLCTSIAEELFIISRLSRSAERSKRIFTGGVVTENGSYSAAFCESAALRGWFVPDGSGLNSPVAFGIAGRFLIASEALVTGLTACALSVTYGDTSPKGRGKSTAGNFLIIPNALAMNLTAWLPLGGAVAQRLRGF